MIDVDAILFRAASEVQSNEETRYYLNGVYVHPHPESGVVLVATDGHRMLCCHDVTGKCDKAAIVRVDPKALAAVKRTDTETPRLTVDTDGHAIVGTYRSLKSAIIDGTFPAYDQVLVPVLKNVVADKTGPSFFKADYLAHFGKVSKIIDPQNTYGSLQLFTYGEHDPAIVRFGNIDNVFGIIMPVRSKKFENYIPIFMKPIIEPARIKAEKKKEAEPTSVAA